ncbi:MAG: hypothetical protein ACTHKT_10280 [Solirubrobacterales bacterium]
MAGREPLGLCGFELAAFGLAAFGFVALGLAFDCDFGFELFDFDDDFALFGAARFLVLV